MRRSRKTPILKNTLLTLLSVAALLVFGFFAREIADLDPFARFRHHDQGEAVNATLSNVRVQSFEGSRLVGRADVDQVTVAQSGQIYRLTGVKNGLYRTKEGEFKFEAPIATWNVPGKVLQASDGGRITNADMNLRVPSFAFSARTNRISVPGEVTGTLRGGAFTAVAIGYDISTRDFSTGPVRWRGELSLLQDQTEKPRPWDIRGDNSSGKGDLFTAINGVATDGDIILMADKIVQNKRTDVVTATGNVRYFSAKANMVCEQAVIERKIKKAVLTGNVKMFVKAKDHQVLSTQDGIPNYSPISPAKLAKKDPEAPGQTAEQKKLDDELRSADNMKNYPTICYSQKVVYYYKRGERRAEITGDPQARQELDGNRWRQVWTNKAYYDGEKETLRMVSSEGKMDTRMINSIGDDFVTEYLVTSTVDGSNDFESGKMKGFLFDYSDEVPTEDGGKTNNGSGGGGSNDDRHGGGGGGGKQTPPPGIRTRL